jgi:hypothetical protein
MCAWTNQVFLNTVDGGSARFDRTESVESVGFAGAKINQLLQKIE